jgi:MoaA/NifB/PqqE/SkfB family radical SAM enzyme
MNEDITIIKPKKIRLDMTSFCQLKCPSCPMTYLPTKEKTGYVHIEQFKDLIDKNPWIKSIELANHGEVFLNPDLLEIFKYSFEKNVELTIDVGVNLNNVKLNVLEGLVKYRIKSMKISIDGASQKTYEQYRIGGNFQTVMNNIDKINEFKKIYDSSYPYLKWTFIVFGHNEHEIPLARKIAKDKNMQFETKLNWDDNFSPIKNIDFVKKETNFKYTNVKDHLKNNENISYLSTMCNNMWISPQINTDGEVFGCCRFLRIPFGGNAFTDGLMNVINSEKIQKARLMLTGQIEDTNDNMCSHCFIYQDMKKTGKYIPIETIKELIKKYNYN